MSNAVPATIIDGLGFNAQSGRSSYLAASLDHRFSELWDALPVDPRFDVPAPRRLEAPSDQTAERPARSLGREVEAWENDVPVERLQQGDQVRHPGLGYPRTIVSVKPHPKGGVQVKTVPTWKFTNRCENPAGKTLKAHLTGSASRWDGKTYISSAV